MYTLKMSAGGRIVIPAEVRKHLQIAEGETLYGELRDGELVLTSQRARLEQARRLFQKYCPPQPGRSLVDEFLAERHAESEQE